MVVRVHPEMLAAEGRRPEEIDDLFWERRFQDIVHFERYLTHNRIRVLKFAFARLGGEEQRLRLLSRLEDPAKNWKFSPTDFKAQGGLEMLEGILCRLRRRCAPPAQSRRRGT